MSTGRHGRITPLTLVAASGTDDARRASGTLDWSKLMMRAQDGDRAAYRMLLEDVAPYIRSLAARCFKEPSDLDDAVQDVLLTLHMVRHAYDPARPFGPWLLAIANRRIIDRLRREMRQKALKVALSAEHETFTGHVTNLDDPVPDDAGLSNAIEALSPEQRQAIRMLKLSEMSLKEAAAASGRSVVALKVATHHAMKKLRRMLRPQSERL
jgi:RNA polymerase sigma-70 factor (ECF subfamily)